MAIKLKRVKEGLLIIGFSRMTNGASRTVPTQAGFS
jgi:hypothetical protein